LRGGAVALVNAQAAGGVVHVAAGRVVYGVCALHAAGHFLVVDLEVPGHGGNFFGAAVQADKTGVETGQVGFEDFGRVPLGVYRDEDDLRAIPFKVFRL